MKTMLIVLATLFGLPAFADMGSQTGSFGSVGYATGSAGSLSFPVGPYGGYSTLTHNGTNVTYPTLAGAISNAVAFDTITLSGILSESTNIFCPVGLTLNFNGATLTNTMPGGGNPGGSAFGISDNVTINGPGKWVVNDGVSTIWIGFSGTNHFYEIGATNWIVQGLNIMGYSDCFYLWATNYFYGVIQNCTLTGWGYDLINEGMTNSPPSGVPWSGVIYNYDVFNNTALMSYQSSRGMLFENCSNTFNNCVWTADDTAYPMAWMTGATTATNDYNTFNNCVFTAFGTTAGSLITLHKSSHYIMNNCVMSAQAAGSIAVNVGAASGAPATNSLNNCFAFGMTNPLIISATSFATATGGNILSAGTTPANFFVLPTLLGASTNTLAVAATGVTNNTSYVYLLTITAGTALAIKDQNGVQFGTPVLGDTIPLKPSWQFTGTAVTAQCYQLQ